MRAKLNLFKTSPASRVADKRHIPGPCGRSELRQTAEAEVMLPARAEVPTCLRWPRHSPHEGRCYCPHQSKNPSQIFSWPGRTFVDSRKDSTAVEQHTGIMGWIYGSLVQMTVSRSSSAFSQAAV